MEKTFRRVKGGMFSVLLSFAMVLAFPIAAYADEGEWGEADYSVAGDKVNLPPQNWDMAEGGGGDGVSAPAPYAFVEQFYFDFKKGQTHRCGPAHKGNFDMAGYADALDGDIYFPSGSRFRAWMCTSGNTQISSSSLITALDTIYTFPYYSNSVPPRYSDVFFRAYVDPSSSTEWVRIWGYFQP